MKNHYFLSLLLIAAPEISSSAVTYYKVQNYQGRSDNPFIGNPSVATVYLEDFELQSGSGTNVLTTPNATAWNGGAVGSPGWSVREDYNSIDAEGEMGWVWGDNVGSPEWRKSPQGLHFDFTPDEFGRYPEYVGAALLGYDDFENVGGLFNSIFVYDKDGNEITSGEWKLPRIHYTENDMENIFTDFEGIYVTGGISRIQFRDFNYVDHLTYGYAPLPEPNTVSLAGLTVAGLLLRRSKRSSFRLG